MPTLGTVLLDLVFSLLAPVAVGVLLLVRAGRAPGAARLVRGAGLVLIVGAPLGLLLGFATPLAFGSGDPAAALYALSALQTALSVGSAAVPVVLLLVALRRVAPTGHAGHRPLGHQPPRR